MKPLIFCLCILASFGTCWSMSLTEARGKLLSNKLGFLSAKYKIDLSRAEEITSARFANPTLFLQSQLNPFGEGWTQSNAGGPTQRDAILNVPVDLNGKRKQAQTVAREMTKVSELLYRAEVSSKIYELDLLYSALYFKTEELSLLKKKKPSSSNKVQLLEAESLLHELRTQAGFHLGIDPSLIMNIESPQVVNKFESLSFYLENAKRHRSDLKAMEASVKMHDSKIDLEKRLAHDDVVFFGGISRQEQVGANPKIPGSTPFKEAYSYTFGLNIPLPVHHHDGEILKSKLEKNQNLLEIENFNKKLEADISISLNRLQTLLELEKELSRSQNKLEHIEVKKRFVDEVFRLRLLTES